MLLESVTFLFNFQLSQGSVSTQSTHWR